MDNDTVWNAFAFLKQDTEVVTLFVRKVFLCEQGIAEGEPGRNAVFLHQHQHFFRITVPESGAPATPETVRRGTIDRADFAPVVKVFPMFPVQGEKYLV